MSLLPLEVNIALASSCASALAAWRRRARRADRQVRDVSSPLPAPPASVIAHAVENSFSIPRFVYEIGPAPAASSLVGGWDQVVRELVEANQRLQAEVCDLKRALGERSRQLDLYARAAQTDELTGLPNRRSFREELDRRLLDRSRGGAALALLLLDLDGFKEVNDAFGHPAGDRVLIDFARQLRAATRAGDMAARLAGDEFAVILSVASLIDALTAAERLRRTVERNGCSVPNGSPPVTLSGGVALHRTGESGEQLIARADVALYVAKRRGRNRVCCDDGRTPVSAETGVETH